MIGALAIKNRRKQLGLTGSGNERGPPPVPSPLANRVYMCYFVAACCIVISVVIAIPAVISDSSLFYYAGVAGGVGLIFFLVTCFLSSPEPSDIHQEVRVEPATSSKPPTLPCSPAPSSCSGKVYPKSISRSAHSRFTRGDSTETTISAQRPGFSRDQSLDIVSISNVISHNDSATSTQPAVRETLIEIPTVNSKSSNISDVAETSIIRNER